MKSWALKLRSDDTVEEVDPIHACGHPVHRPFVWVHLDAGEDDAVAWLKEHARMDSAPLAALTAIETRPRTETFGEGALVNLRGLAAEADDAGDALVSIRMWAEAGRVISVSFHPLAALEPARERMKAGRIRDPGDLVAAIARLITDGLNPEIAKLGDTLDECEAGLDPEQAFAMRRTIGGIRSEAIGYRRFVTPERQALERLSELEADWLEEDDRIHLRGAADGFARMAEELEAVRERSALMHEQLTDLRAEQIETRTLVISIVALVFLPLTFLTGLLGMNVAGIPFAKEPWAFAAVVALCVVVAGSITVYFVRAHWFRG